MITNNDIKRIVEASKEIFATKDEFNNGLVEIKDGISSLHTTVDNFALKVHRHDQEITLINHRLDKLENPAS